MPPLQTTLLLIEDDDVDARAMRRGVESCGVGWELRRVRDGVAGLDLLRGTGSDDGPLPRPYIILVDLNMPRMDGIEFLRELRADRRLRDAVVFALTTSGSPREREAAYRHDVAGFVVKSHTGDDFTRLIRLIDRYLDVVELPT